MTNPVSVLLIIGVAVVGPIDAQHFPSAAARANYEKCAQEEPARLKRDGPSSVGCSAHLLQNGAYESLPQLCERVMKDAGATLKSKYAHTMFDENGNMLRMTDGFGPGNISCIPTPTGYRK